MATGPYTGPLTVIKVQNRKTDGAQVPGVAARGRRDTARTNRNLGAGGPARQGNLREAPRRMREVRNTQLPGLRFLATLGEEPKIELTLV
jgi:hypothetical protein